MSKKFQITMDDDLLNKVDEFAFEHCLSRSSAICYIVSRNLNILKQTEQNVVERVEALERRTAQLSDTITLTLGKVRFNLK